MPLLLFFYGGWQLQVRAPRVASVDGALVGGIATEPLRQILQQVRDAGRAGQGAVEVTYR